MHAIQTHHDLISEQTTLTNTLDMKCSRALTALLTYDHALQINTVDGTAPTALQLTSPILCEAWY